MLTLDKTQEAQQFLNKVQEAASEINTILVKVQENIFEDVVLDATQKTSLLAKYNTAKIKLTTAVNNLL